MGVRFWGLFVARAERVVPKCRIIGPGSRIGSRLYGEDQDSENFRNWKKVSGFLSHSFLGACSPPIIFRPVCVGFAVVRAVTHFRRFCSDRPKICAELLGIFLFLIIFVKLVSVRRGCYTGQRINLINLKQ